MNFSLNGIFPKIVLKKSSRSSLGRASCGCVAGVDSQTVLWSPQARAFMAREGVHLVGCQVGSLLRHWQLCPKWVLFFLHPKISPPGHDQWSNLSSPHPMCVLITSVVSNFFQPFGLQPTRLLCLWDSPGKNAGVGGHAFLQGLFPTQGSNPCLLHLLSWQVDFLLILPPGKPSLTLYFLALD